MSVGHRVDEEEVLRRAADTTLRIVENCSEMDQSSLGEHEFERHGKTDQCIELNDFHAFKSGIFARYPPPNVPQSFFSRRRISGNIDGKGADGWEV